MSVFFLLWVASMNFPLWNTEKNLTARREEAAQISRLNQNFILATDDIATSYKMQLEGSNYFSSAQVGIIFHSFIFIYLFLMAHKIY